MSANQPGTKSRPSPDSAYTFSFAIGIGLVLFIAGLVISITLAESSAFGLFFGIPLLLAGLVVPLIMLRSLFRRDEVEGNCPHCETPIKTSDATILLECPNCRHEISVREGQLHARETSS
jgi:predicted RNA-binding Zn-ribbon protein involved in translation (DUF1610 family)